jgi:monofunctional glycosyltransferase
MRSAGRVAAGFAAAAFAVLAYIYLSLPDVRPLATLDPETTAFMELRSREARAAGRELRHQHRWVPYGRISDSLTRAVLVAEDSTFWEHDGIDLEQIQKSFEINLEKGKMLRGGSTITQQLAKNLYLSPSRNPVRKLRELLITRRLEAELSKRRILELYLNLIEWGDGIWGAEAAARAYFGKPASALSAPEAALLAGAIVNPRILSPANPSSRLLARQRLVLRRMRYVEPPAVVDANVLPDVAPFDSTEPASLPGSELPPEQAPPPKPLPFPIPER